MPSTSSVSPSGDKYIDGTLTGIKWATASLTFSFPSSASYYGSGYGSGEPGSNFQQFNSAQEAAVKSILAMYSSVAKISFSEVTETSSNHGYLRFAETDKYTTGFAYYPSSSAAGGDVWLGNSSNYFNAPAKGNYAWFTIVHEIGHALGLKHAHESMGKFGTMPLDRDSTEYTVMSYRSWVGASTAYYTNAGWSYPQTLMMQDIAALQKLYGANYNTNSGDTIYRWDPTTGEEVINGTSQGRPGANQVFATVWDGGGKDTYDFSNYTTNLKISLQPGEWSNFSSEQLANLGNGHYAPGNLANALLYQGNLASLIENANGGAGDDTFKGNAANNTFRGGIGNDYMDGGTGADKMFGGLGNDSYVVDNTGDSVDETGGGGRDTVLSRISFSLADQNHAIGGIENLTLTGTANINATGNDLANCLRGNAGSNTLIGGGGDDTLHGYAGADKMLGGLGDDTYVVDNTGDVINETGGGGSDRVLSYISFSLADSVHAIGGIENLMLLGTTPINATGNVLNNVLIGNSAANVLIGGAGADKLDGCGGFDTASYVTAGSRVVVSLATGTGAGSDAKGDCLFNIENLTGSNFDDTLEGNASNNILVGGLGSDTVSYAHATAGANGVGVCINLALTSAQNTVTAGTDTLMGFERVIGSEFNDTFRGNSGNNVLTGLGGNDWLDGKAGADRMFGGTGNDTYVVDNAGDVADETGGSGTDKVLSYISFSLADPLHVIGSIENLMLLGSGAINATGNALDNFLGGNSGVNVLIGGAGADTLDGCADADQMFGRTGNDTYVVDNAGDVVDETGGDGADTVWSSIGFSLADPIHAIGAIENLTLIGSGAINATGDDLDNVLTGNSATNVLTGEAGADHLDGSGGVDTASYVTSGAGVAVSLATGTGYGGDAVGDRLFNIENLTGSNFDDQLEGNDGNNILVGGLGTDTISYANATSGANGEGVTVNLAETSAQNTIMAGTDTLTGFANLTGSQFNDTLTGTSGNNVISGLGGNDTLTGAGGNDTFVFLPGSGKDSITDFSAGPNSSPHDLITFDDTIFADFDTVMAASTQVGSSTVITVDAQNSITLANVSLGSLHHDDFAFV